MHLTRFWRTGDPLKVKCPFQNTEADFWSRVDKSPGLGPHGDCWEWVGCRKDTGYGTMQYDGVLQYTHRLAWFFTYGALPAQLMLHSCDNPPCCNPNHLRNGSHADNHRDARERGRAAKGERNGLSKLTDDQVREIKMRFRDAPESDNRIAQDFGVTDGCIFHIRRGYTWGHIAI